MNALHGVFGRCQQRRHPEVLITLLKVFVVVLLGWAAVALRRGTLLRDVAMEVFECVRLIAGPMRSASSCRLFFFLVQKLWVAHVFGKLICS
jgi:hypothetical protein